MNMPYKGRFAPTPSGPAHLGTMLAAVGSYLQAKANNGQWHVRIDDIDPPREAPGAADSILWTLENFGLYWDGPVVYQSQRGDAYHEALEKLAREEATFACTCSRKMLSETARRGPNGMIYPGTCRNGHHHNARQKSIRLLTEDTVITVPDLIQGDYALNMANDIGDFVIRRADELFSYHLATVVDDALDGFTEIVRGKDQLSLTPQHVYMQQLLGVTTPRYAHLPLLIDSQGNKLAKSSNASAVDAMSQADVWSIVLGALGLEAEEALLQEPPAQILQWAFEQWDLFAIDATDKIAQ